MIADGTAMIVMSLLLLVAYAWTLLVVRAIRGDDVLPFAPRRRVPWGVISVVLSFLLFLGVQVAVGAAFGMKPGAEPTIAETSSLLTWTAVAILAATILSISLICLFTKAGSNDFGISFENVPRDLLVGCYGFLILGPIAFLIQFVCVYVFELESHHPLIELVKEDATGQLFAVVTFLAVVVAPISEEYFFRVILQGWLERIFLFRITEEVAPAPSMDVERSFVAGTEALSPATPDSGTNPYSSPHPIADDDSPYVAPVAAKRAFVPIVISAGVFALMHWSHGPDPATLFVLALGLGYLYQRTHRWLPSVVTHACLNGTTMLILWFGLDQLGP